MNVAEKDPVVVGLLEDELQRCVAMLAALCEQIEKLPKGVLNRRQRVYKDRIYSYSYTVARVGGKVVNRHVSSKDEPKVIGMIEQRKRLESEADVYRNRIQYLGRLLNKSTDREVHGEMPYHGC